MEELEKIVNFITRTNWFLFLGSSLVALALAPPKVYLGGFSGRSDRDNQLSCS